MNHTALSTSPEEIQANKIAEVAERISIKSKSITGKNSESEQANIQGFEFAKVLFDRAPIDFLELRGVEQLEDIAELSYKFYLEFLKSKVPFTVEVQELKSAPKKGSLAYILTAMNDRPFIVDTLTEHLQADHIRHHVLLHPIIRGNSGNRTSLIYIGLDQKVNDSQKKLLKQQIEQRLANLILACDDFPAMLERVDSAVKNIQATPSIVDSQEVANYLKWLADGGFVFLGYREWHLASSSTKTQALRHEADNDLGLFRTVEPKLSKALEDVNFEANFLLSNTNWFINSKIYAKSPVHRYACLDVVTIKLTGKLIGQEANGALNPSKIVCFIGLYTSRAVSQESSSVPLIRKKLNKILEAEALLPNSHDYKEIISVVDSMPKSELLQYEMESLRRDIQLIISLQRRSDIKLRYRADTLKRFISLIVVIPKERYSSGIRGKIETYLKKIFEIKDNDIEISVASSDYPLVILHLLLPYLTQQEIKISANELEQGIKNLTMTWDDHLASIYSSQFADQEAPQLVLFYLSAFPEQYKVAYSPQEAVSDIVTLQSLSPENPLTLAITKATNSAEEHIYQLKLYRLGENLTLSAILPFLENAGLSILRESVTSLKTTAAVNASIYSILVSPKRKQIIDLELAKTILLPGLTKILSNSADNDNLNELLLSPGLSLKNIALLRTLTHYIIQIKAATSDQSVINALIENPLVAMLIVRMFESKFDPTLELPEQQTRQELVEKVGEEFSSALKNVTQLVHDRILRALHNVIEATVRTNFFRLTDDLRISIKIDCSRITRMPFPRPLFEIFVNAPDFEGVHLRGGKVARGGIRWSDRIDDYRTEVLGLMKTQMLKNAIIVPVGAKGGFVLRNRPSAAQELADSVKLRYTRFIRSLLELADNRVGGSIVHPPQAVIYDGDDPYFVVAADRGTATFSDLANGIAVNDFKLWLGDAFASGGSNGYDHKKLAITARGAWENVRRHFREIGIDTEEQEFTVIGIGDMSGDVFGNGLLRSRKAKLLAAFDHRHIFIDPSPDPEKSFQERLRLFQLPTSSWNDYNHELLSPGGAIYPRSQKEINLSEEAKSSLGIDSTTLSGEELVRAVLMAPVDLLWNGGIGTYVKASTEDNINVSDRANDDVRVDAQNLRVKVVAEGGNLGFTQLARIEYTKIGGHINTDAVDNSGGVHLSDREVNLKILLRAPLERKALSLDERNKLLTSLADEVCETVISRNRAHSLALSLGVIRSRKHLSYYRSLSIFLEKNGFLDRKAEFLPDDATFIKRAEMKAGLTRPELAVIGGYARMWMFNAIVESSLPDEKIFNKYLIDYFPKSVFDRFPNDILNHPLRREIIATEVTNSLVSRMGAGFVHRVSTETGSSSIDVIRAFVCADYIVGGDRITEELRIIDKVNSSRLHLSTLIRLAGAIDGVSRWLLDSSINLANAEDQLKAYTKGVEDLLQHTDSLTADIERNRYREHYKQLVLGGLPKELAHRIASIVYSTAFLDILSIADDFKKIDVLDIARLYAQLSLLLHLRQLLELAASIEATDKAEASSLRILSNNLRHGLAKLASRVIKSSGNAHMSALDEYLSKNSELLNRFHSSYQEFSSKPLTIPALLVLANQLEALSE